MKKVFELDFNGRKLVVETGELAKQTNGSVLVRYGDTAVLSVCVMGKNMVSQDFFPLTVLYQERLYSVGKIPGGFIKREGRPSDAATLAARLIDRPIRPMFDENLRNEIQVINTVFGRQCFFKGRIAGKASNFCSRGFYIIYLVVDKQSKTLLTIFNICCSLHHSPPFQKTGPRKYGSIKSWYFTVSPRASSPDATLTIFSSNSFPAFSRLFLPKRTSPEEKSILFFAFSAVM